MKLYHLIALTEEQRKAILSALHECGEGLGDDVYFLEKTLEACPPGQLNDIEGLDTQYYVTTTLPAEIAYLESCLDRERGWAEKHRAKGEQLMRDGFSASAQYDLGVADICEARALGLADKIKELKDGM